MNFPNLITLARIILVPIVIWLLLSERTQAAFLLFVVAGITDAIDGFLAKRFGWTTELGAYLDPLADKVLVVCIFACLGVLGELPLWLVIAVISRDVLIIAAVVLSWLLDNPVRIRPFVISKANTAAQIVLAAVVMADVGFGLGLEQVRFVLVWLTAVLTVVSLASYLRAWVEHMSSA